MVSLNEVHASSERDVNQSSDWLEKVRTEIRIVSDRIRPAVRPKFCSYEQKVVTPSV